MGDRKKIVICLSDQLLQEIDSVVLTEHMNRSAFVREAMRFYINEKKKSDLRIRMMDGYQEMAEINRTLAEFCFEAEEEQRVRYEKRLGELDKLW